MRKDRLFSAELAATMVEKDIFFVLIQIEEAHTALWPQGVIKLGIPQHNQEDRRARAAAFAATIPEVAKDRFAVYVDTWSNSYANRYRAWPDKYYLFNAEKVVRAKSTYGAHADALIDHDCVDLILDL
jgi:hypothetical protein